MKGELFLSTQICENGLPLHLPKLKCSSKTRRILKTECLQTEMCVYDTEFLTVLQVEQ